MSSSTSTFVTQALFSIAAPAMSEQKKPAPKPEGYVAPETYKTDIVITKGIPDAAIDISWRLQQRFLTAIAGSQIYSNIREDSRRVNDSDVVTAGTFEQVCEELKGVYIVVPTSNPLVYRAYIPTDANSVEFVAQIYHRTNWADPLCLDPFREDALLRDVTSHTPLGVVELDSEGKKVVRVCSALPEALDDLKNKVFRLPQFAKRKRNDDPVKIHAQGSDFNDLIIALRVIHSASKEKSTKVTSATLAELKRIFKNFPNMREHLTDLQLDMLNLNIKKLLSDCPVDVAKKNLRTLVNLGGMQVLYEPLAPLLKNDSGKKLTILQAMLHVMHYLKIIEKATQVNQRSLEIFYAWFIVIAAVEKRRSEFLTQKEYEQHEKHKYDTLPANLQDAIFAHRLIARCYSDTVIWSSPDDLLQCALSVWREYQSASGKEKAIAVANSYGGMAKSISSMLHNKKSPAEAKENAAKVQIPAISAVSYSQPSLR